MNSKTGWMEFALNEEVGRGVQGLPRTESNLRNSKIRLPSGCVGM